MAKQLMKGCEAVAEAATQAGGKDVYLMEEPVAAQPQRRYTPSQSRVQATAMTKPKIQPKVDSLKFLESMSEIYEKSGRPDLANGIRTKLSKVSK